MAKVAHVIGLGIGSAAPIGLILYCANVVAEREGFRATPYNDGKGVSIGYGFYYPVEAEAPKTISKVSAWAKLIGIIAASCAYLVSKDITLLASPRRLSALVSLRYNIGSGAFNKSTLWAYHLDGQFMAAAQEFKKWNKSNGAVIQGLVVRRALEEADYRGA